MPLNATVKSCVIDFCVLFEKKSKILFCDTCNELLQKKFEKHLTSKSQSHETSGKTKRDLCGFTVKKHTHNLHLKSIKLLLSLCEKTKCSICKEYDTVKSLEHNIDELHEAQRFC